jgi:hypothetical protein
VTARNCGAKPEKAEFIFERFLFMKIGVVSVMCLGLMTGSAFAQNTDTQQSGWTQKDFITTMWVGPPATDENFAQLAREGYNLYPTYYTDTPSMSPVALLDMAKKHGLKILFGNPLIVPASLDDPAKKAKLAELIETVKNHPALEGYNLFDEPSATSFPVWAKLTQFLREHDPNHFSYINLFPSNASQPLLGVFLNDVPKDPQDIPENFCGIGIHKDTFIFYNEYLRQFIKQVKPEILSYDHYHFIPGKDGDQYFLNLELVKDAAQQAGIPFVNIVQASDIEGRRMPNKTEIRWLAYTTMAYGARGINWFLYWGPARWGGMYQDGKRMPHADWVVEVNQDVKALGPELMKLASTQVYHTNPVPVGAQSIVGSPVQVTGGQYVVGMFKEKNTTNAFMIVNRDYKNASIANMTLNMGKGILMEFSLPKREWVKVKPIINGSTLNVALISGNGKLFKIVTEP